MQNLPSILVLRVSRALELCNRASSKALSRTSRRASRGRPPWTPLRTACSIRCVASTLGGQRCYKAFGRAFGELRTELRAELLQGFGRA